MIPIPNFTTGIEVTRSPVKQKVHQNNLVVMVYDTEPHKIIIHFFTRNPFGLMRVVFLVEMVVAHHCNFNPYFEVSAIGEGLECKSGVLASATHTHTHT